MTNALKTLNAMLDADTHQCDAYFIIRSIMLDCDFIPDAPYYAPSILLPICSKCSHAKKSLNLPFRSHFAQFTYTTTQSALTTNSTIAPKSASFTPLTTLDPKGEIMHNHAHIAITDTSDPLDTFLCEYADCTETATILCITIESDMTLSNDLNEHIPFCTRHATINAITLILDNPPT
jgi:hypothetical protein